MYIVLEGMDCTGKTTMAKALVKLFRQEGYDVVHLHEPYKNNEPQAKIRTLITDSKLLDETKGILALASRIELFKKRIEPALEKDKIVICERNFVSTLVYQGGDDPEPLLKLHQEAFEAFNANMYPDVLIHLENSHNQFLERLEQRGESLDKIEEALVNKDHFIKLKARYDNAIKLSVKRTKTAVYKGKNLTAKDIFEQLM